MKRYNIDGGIPTLAVALSEHMNASELKKLASLAGGPVPARKAELADLIANISGATGCAPCGRASTSRRRQRWLIAPKRFDVPWKDLEQQALIATATCVDVRARAPRQTRHDHARGRRDPARVRSRRGGVPARHARSGLRP